MATMGRKGVTIVSASDSANRKGIYHPAAQVSTKLKNTAKWEVPYLEFLLLTVKVVHHLPPEEQRESTEIQEQNDLCIGASDIVALLT